MQTWGQFSIPNFEWTCMNYTSAGGIVALGKLGKALRIGDGQSTVVSTNSTNDWTSLTGTNLNGGWLVSVSETGTQRIMVSDPFFGNQTLITAPANNQWTCISCDGSGWEATNRAHLVAVAKSGTGNRIMTSQDCYTWTLRSSPADNEWTAVTYGGGLWVAVAKSGIGNRVMTSPDGFTWTLRSSAADNDWSAIVFSRGTFIAVASGGPSNRVMTSTDGINWTLGNVPEVNLCRWTSLVATTPGPGIVIAVGGGEGTQRAMMSIDDGINWALMDTANNAIDWTGLSYSPAAGWCYAVSSNGGVAMSIFMAFEIPLIPTPPTITSITAYNQSANIYFTLNAPDEYITNYAYSYSVNGGATFNGFTRFDPVSVSSPLTITGLPNNSVVSFCIRSWNGLFYSTSSNIIYNKYVYTTEPIICFKYDTKILTSNGYIPICELKQGDLVETFCHGLKPITVIDQRNIIHEATEDRHTDQLYKYCKSASNELTEDLIVTGRHAILVDNFVSDQQKQLALVVYGFIKETDGKYHLPAAVDENSVVYEIPGNYTVYHLALQNDDENMNYGIYANGMLVESCSEKYLRLQTKRVRRPPFEIKQIIPDIQVNIEDEKTPINGDQ